MKPNKKIEKISDLLCSATFLAIFVIFFVILLSLTVGYFMFFHNFDGPEANIGNYHYESTEEYTPHGLPINLTDFDVEVLDYYYRKSSGMLYPLSHHGTYVDSLAENPTQVITLSYDIWDSSTAFVLDRKEKSLQRKYGKEIVDAELDYGAQKAYWAGNSLLLRYEGKLICFYGETPVELLDSEACAAYMREHFCMKKTPS